MTYNPNEEIRKVLSETDVLIDFLEAGGDHKVVLEILKDLTERSITAQYAFAYPETLERVM